MGYEAGPRHADIVTDERGLKDAKGVLTFGTHEEGTTKESNETKLDDYHTGRCRATVARLHYLTSVRPDIAASVRGFARSKGSPGNGC